MKTKLTIIIAVAVASLLIIIGSTWIFSSNKEIKLRNKIEAQQTVCKAYYDKLWKVISQKAQVADEYKNAFDTIYPKLIEGRYGDEKGGTLLKFITESNPDFDITLYKEVSNSIEAERAGFFAEQQILIDLKNEHNNLRQTFPSKIFVGSRPEIELNIISSDKTDAVYSEGKENDVEVFK